MYSLLIPIRAFQWVRRYCNLARTLMRNALTLPLGTYMYTHENRVKGGMVDFVPKRIYIAYPMHPRDW
jgi:hypothetical protein